MPPSKSASQALSSPQIWGFKETQEDPAGFGEGARIRGGGEQESQSFAHSESTFPWAEVI